ncbi:MAG: phosphoribosylformylglycinamidine cyclo-ligase [Armatimonadetes bacterium]|nr:phosphoribosylformylglycinamidine cyclo-ligase [Armatimonadota bacterium]
MDKSPTYAEAGVDIDRAGRALKRMLGWINRTGEFRPGLGRSVMPIGHFANVVDIGHGMGLAVSTDGVGTKILIAEMLDKYDTVGIDCIAMNVNDLICVGAEPICMLDCLSVEEADEQLLEEIGKGLYEGARQARISIPGGEIAQIRDMLKGARPGRSFDLVGTAMGLVEIERIILGSDIVPGDVVVGLRSSGLHSNGFSLVRKVLLEQARLPLEGHVDELGRTLGEELIEPTRIYVPAVMALLQGGVPVKGLANITGDGFLNLVRLDAPVGYRLTDLPEPPPIFGFIQRTGGIDPGEMFLTFNMGIGFCVICAPDAADQVIAVCSEHNTPAQVIGHAVAEPSKQVVLEKEGLLGHDGRFTMM